MESVFRIVTVDSDGYCGREFHPEPSDVGALVLPVGLETFVYDEDGDELENPAPDVLLKAIAGGRVERLWRCLTVDGRVLELVAHEIELWHGDSPFAAFAPDWDRRRF